MIQRGAEVMIQMLRNVKQSSISPLIQSMIAPGTLVYTDEYDIYNRLSEWGYGHKTVCHSNSEYAQDEDGDRFHEVHVNTMEGFCRSRINGSLCYQLHCQWCINRAVALECIDCVVFRDFFEVHYVLEIPTDNHTTARKRIVFSYPVGCLVLFSQAAMWKL
jgi:transposase-like protein